MVAKNVDLTGVEKRYWKEVVKKSKLLDSFKIPICEKCDMPLGKCNTSPSGNRYYWCDVCQIYWVDEIEPTK